MSRRDLAAIFESAPGLAERVGARTDSEDPETIVSVARDELARMTDAERVAVLDAHPRIGAEPASLSRLSRAEQEEGDDPATQATLRELNDLYERRFGFRFVVFVGGRSRAELVQEMRRRLTRARAEELATGIDEFLAITRDRLRGARA